jgi:hypothetical protein
MRKNIILLCNALILSIFLFPVSAQDRLMNMEEFEKRKREFVKEAVGLTQEEADKYFPLSSELARRQLELYRNHRERAEQMKEGDDAMTDEEYRILLENDVELRQQQAALEKKFNEKFKEVLSPERLYNARQAERAFMQRELANFRANREREEEEQKEE